MQLHDIRVGTVDENLAVTAARREKLNALLKPRPERADHLEEVFRALGYHARTAELDRLGISRNQTVNLEQVMNEGVKPKVAGSRRWKPCVTSLIIAWRAGGPFGHTASRVPSTNAATP